MKGGEERKEGWGIKGRRVDEFRSMPGGWEVKKEEADAAERAKGNIFCSQQMERSHRSQDIRPRSSLSIMRSPLLCQIRADKLPFSLSKLHFSVPPFSSSALSAIGSSVCLLPLLVSKWGSSSCDRCCWVTEFQGCRLTIDRRECARQARARAGERQRRS